MTKDRPSSRGEGLAMIAGVSFAVLVIEVTLTRVFSFRIGHHLSGLAIAIPFLGFGAAGSLLALPRVEELRRVADAATRRRALVSATLAFAFLSLVGFWGGAAVDIDANAMDQLGQVLNLLRFLFLTTIPFVFAGLVVCELLAEAGEDVGLVYAADLLAAAAGAGLVLVLLEPLGAPALVTLAGMVAVAGALPAARRGSRGLLACALVSFLGLTGFLVADRTSWHLDVEPTSSRELVYLEAEGARPVFSRWHPICRIDVGIERRVPALPGGMSQQNWPHLAIASRLVYQDAGAPTQLIGQAVTPEEAVWPGLLLQAAPYALHERPEVAVIGVGGGPDIWVALHHRARRVVGVEINPVTVSLLREHFRAYTHDLIARPEFDLRCDEGRHFMASTQERFDVIQLSGVDTFASSLAGSQAMAESYLYTTEAIRDLHARLKPGGVLSFARWLFQPPRESLRLMMTMLATAREAGEPHPERCVAVVTLETFPNAWAEVMLKRGGFTEEDGERLRAWATERGFQVRYLPGLVPGLDNAFGQAVAADGASFAAAYPYAIEPCTDDRPFFFNFYKLETLFSPPVAGIGGYEPTRTPLGLVFMVACLAAVGLLSVVLILLPLVPRLSALRRLPARGAHGLYFACLGVGFMVFEIAVIQRSIVLVGGPVRAVAVVVVSLLLAVGVGSAVSDRLEARLGGRGRVLALVALALLVEWLLFGSALGAAAMQWALPVRMALVALALAPAGVLMGTAFPLGLRALERAAPEATPWAWGVNACLSVLGSSATPILAVFLGFSGCLLAAAGIYALAAAAAFVADREAGREEAGGSTAA